MVSLSNVYIAQTNWNYMEVQQFGQLPQDGVWTAVLKFALNNGEPSFSKLMTVPGSVLNQVSSVLSYYRIVSSVLSYCPIVSSVLSYCLIVSSVF